MSAAFAASTGSTVTSASACSRVTARYSASRSVSQSCSRAIRHAVPRDARSPSNRILSSVTRSWVRNASFSVRTPRRTSRSSICSASDRIGPGATSWWPGSTV